VTTVQNLVEMIEDLTDGRLIAQMQPKAERGGAPGAAASPGMAGQYGGATQAGMYGAAGGMAHAPAGQMAMTTQGLGGQQGMYMQPTGPMASQMQAQHGYMQQAPHMQQAYMQPQQPQQQMLQGGYGAYGQYGQQQMPQQSTAFLDAPAFGPR
jgi:hypothetical protein